MIPCRHKASLTNRMKSNAFKGFKWRFQPVVHPLVSK